MTAVQFQKLLFILYITNAAFAVGITHESSVQNNPRDTLLIFLLVLDKLMIRVDETTNEFYKDGVSAAKSLDMQRNVAENKQTIQYLPP